MNQSIIRKKDPGGIEPPSSQCVEAIERSPKFELMDPFATNINHHVLTHHFQPLSTTFPVEKDGVVENMEIRITTAQMPSGSLFEGSLYNFSVGP